MLHNPILLLPIVIFAALIIARFVLSAKPAKKDDTEPAEWPCYAKKLLSSPEQVLYHRMRKALPDHLVFAQVGLSRIVGVRQGNGSQACRNRISQKSVDFVVCTKDGSVVAAIELDDSSHNHPDRKAADATKDKALEAAGIRIIRWKTNALPDAADIMGTVLSTAVPSENRHPLFGAASGELSAASR